MTHYTITNTTSGLCLGTYDGATPADALDAMARDAGYADHAAACEVTGDDGSDLRVSPVSMSSSEVAIGGVAMSMDAATSVEECGVDVAADVARLRRGEITRADLLAECLDGADDDRVSAWHEYVSAVASAAGVEA